ncbi:MAG: hypothetical protein H0X11_06405 [Betaproteobacteria bacterium]|nr:hypothetical protein [Betaproteobacteria bacterium]
MNLFDDTVTRRRLEALFAGLALSLAADTATLAADAVAQELAHARAPPGSGGGEVGRA